MKQIFLNESKLINSNTNIMKLELDFDNSEIALEQAKEKYNSHCK